ncbi:hypothetical protein [Lichenifustis flavocetrariae]|uniref:Uncharacterized protein n=1 Tax=Lichenifustis flavocetrariae TaxID=2949735 RepID=A0AA42CNM2_9HYPH|nr:hypothetical protein [Lichenifustis flavocetrariae]MCW6512946.1 hypothetical protein [Lichenifustis flavocetrariae]
MQGYFATKQLPGTGDAQTAAAWIDQMVELQSSFLAYIDVFFVLILVAVAIAGIALTLRGAKRGGVSQGVALAPAIKHRHPGPTAIARTGSKRAPPRSPERLDDRGP